MGKPNDTDDLPESVELYLVDGRLQPSRALIDLLVRARSAYDWPAGAGASQSQQSILNLEAAVAGLVNNLNPNAAHTIVEKVSYWAGNNAVSHSAIVNATQDTMTQMQSAITLLVALGGPGRGLDALSVLPGVSLVIASKIYRFCIPSAGAAVDRHASYFFNSLDIVAPNKQGAKATHFLREWANGRHATSRLAIYNRTRYMQNRQEFTEHYLPVLAQIADELNALPAHYMCAATGRPQTWRPADVEMAAYYWWACHGSR